MNPFWLGVITGGVFGACFGFFVAALLSSAKTSALYAEIEWSRHREEQLRNIAEAMSGSLGSPSASYGSQGLG